MLFAMAQRRLSVADQLARSIVAIPHGLLTHFLSSTLRILSRLLQTPAQKIAASAMMRTACSTGAAVRPKGPNGTHRSFQSDQ
jgi:hypothetical protein